MSLQGCFGKLAGGIFFFICEILWAVKKIINLNMSSRVKRYSSSKKGALLSLWWLKNIQRKHLFCIVRTLVNLPSEKDEI